MKTKKTKKFLDVRARHPKMRIDTFEKFYNRDWTETKKYFEYMVKMWDGNRYNRKFPFDISINDFVTLVREFDTLLPYITQKDIYSAKYSNYDGLYNVVEDAKITKVNKTFVKKDHVNEIYECDEFFMIEPKTHVGSLKYGSSTRWCTASKRNRWAFDSYKSKGSLIYIIDKTGRRSKNYEKLAIYINKNNKQGFNGSYAVYNVTDNSVDETAMINNGWSFDELMLIDMYARNFHHNSRRIDESKKYVKSIMSKLEGIDFQRLNKEVHFLKTTDESDELKNT